jgi:nucleotide-binding universal stress UspA family protein
MSVKDILLHLDSYPDPTPFEAMDWTISFAGLLQARLTALAVRVRFPVQSNKLADYLVGLSGMAREAEEKSAIRCRELLQAFESKATAAGVFEGGISETTAVYDVGDRVADHAQTHDLTVIPLSAPADTPGGVPETVLFGSGRPVITLHPTSRTGSAKLDTIVVAWDGSRPAARAVADAMPFLTFAKRVHVLTVLHEKESAVVGLGGNLARHLKLHGIESKLDEVDAEGVAIGTVLEHYVKSLPADLLVMGAYGHSRVREFVLGGATHSVLSAPPVPVLLSH